MGSTSNTNTLQWVAGAGCVLAWRSRRDLCDTGTLGPSTGKGAKALFVLLLQFSDSAAAGRLALF